MDNIYTERLVIRKFNKGDGPGLYQYLSDPQVVFYEPYEVFTPEEAAVEAEKRAENPAFYAVALKNGQLIGNLYLGQEAFNACELGYVFNRNYWGHGYAREAAFAILEYAFNILGTHRVFSMCNPDNERSWRLMEGLGMRREGRLIKNVYFKKDSNGEPVWQDTFIYAVLKNEWQDRRL